MDPDADDAAEQLHGDPLHGPSLIDVLPRGPAYVVDEDRARNPESACLVREVRTLDGEGYERVVFKDGMVGPLDPEQEILYCERSETGKLTPAQEKRLERLVQAARTCEGEVAPDPDQQAVQPYLTCVERELRRK